MLQIHMLGHASRILLMEAVCHEFAAQDPSSHRGYLASVFIGTGHRDSSDLSDYFMIFLHYDGMKIIHIY